MRTRLIRWIPLVILVMTAPLDAQAVHPGKHIRLRAPGFLLDRFEGVYIGRSGDTLIFGNDDRGPVRVPSSAITSLDVSHGLSRVRGSLRGAFWGGVSLAAASALITSDPAFDTGTGSKSEFILTGTVNGAVLGAIVGAFVPARVWRASDPRILLNAASDGAVGARLAVAF